MSEVKTYTAHYAEDVPHYATVELTAATDDAAIALAKALTSDDQQIQMFDADWSAAVCRRIVQIEAPDGTIIAEDLALDECRIVTRPDPHTLSLGEAMTALCVWEYLDQASANADRHPALVAHRELVGSYALRETCITLAPYCERVHAMLPIDVTDTFAYDWEIIPEIIDRLSWPCNFPPEAEMAAAVAAALSQPANEGSPRPP
jgi:hypothetical protein